MCTCVYMGNLKKKLETDKQRNTQAAIRPAAAVPEQPSCDCLYRKLLWMTSPQPSWNLGSLVCGPQAGSNFLQSVLTSPPPQFDRTQPSPGGQSQERSNPQEQHGCSGNSHLPEVQWASGGTNSLQSFSARTGTTGAREMGTDATSESVAR